MKGRHADQDEQTNWNSVYAMKEWSETPQYDDWLVKHTDLLEVSRNMAILDLGCGVGCDSLFLSERGFDVISCDWSEEALQHVKRHVPRAHTRQINLLEPLPFADNSVEIVIADLSLHYFTWEATQAILSELQRILRSGGYLLSRVNSVRDVNYGAGIGKAIEPNYYEHEGRLKRFFDTDQIHQIMAKWDLTYLEEATLHRYGKPKILWELAAKNVK